MNIRSATSSDREDIRSVHLSAFPEAEREAVAKLAVDLLSEQSIPQTISLVAESDRGIVGHVAFSPVNSKSSGEFLGYILAPLAIKPEFQKHKIGSRLIEKGIQQLVDKGVCFVLVYGDPDYYGRFGFSAETAERFMPPYKLQYPLGWQVVALNERNLEGPAVDIACVVSLSDPALW